MKPFINLAIAVVATLIASVGSAQESSDTLLCPVNKEPIVKGGPVVEYQGVRYEFCCPGCDKKFEANPKKYLETAEKEGIAVGRSVFDVVALKRVDEDTKFF